MSGGSFWPNVSYSYFTNPNQTTMETMLDHAPVRRPLAAIAAEGEHLLSRYTVLRLLNVFQANGYFTEANRLFSEDDLKKNIGVLPAYNRLFAALLDILERGGFITRQAIGWQTTSLVSDMATLAEAQLIEQSEGDYLTDDEPVKDFICAYVRLGNACFDAFFDLLTGRKRYMDVLFPAGDMSLVASIYTGNIQSYQNRLVAANVRQLVKANRRAGTETVQILEVGAGTGGTSAVVFRSLVGHEFNVNYWYTDVSAGFARFGKREFGTTYPYTQFKALDISRSPADQGFQPESIDILVCNNVLHATTDITSCLRHAGSLLKPGGYAVINDLTARLDFNTVTFGFTNDWWNYADDAIRIPHCPILSNATWKQVLTETGFGSVDILGIPGVAVERFHQSVMLARKQ